MKVLKPTTDAQTIKFIPREYITNGVFQLRDDQTNERVDYYPTITVENDYIVVNGVFNLIEGHYYDIFYGTDNNIWDENVTQWQLETNLWNESDEKKFYVVDKIFCTAQEIDQNKQKGYSINKGEYKSDNSYSNDYIIL